MEIRHVLEDRKLVYEGLYNWTELYQMMDNWFKERNYQKVEKVNFEEVKEDHRFFHLELEPKKKVSDYIRIKVKIKIICHDVRDVEVEHDGKKEILQSSKMNITFSAKVETDYENKWEAKPFYFFLRTLMDKYVYKGIIHRYEQEVLKDQEAIEEEIKAYLNLHKYKK